MFEVEESIFEKYTIKCSVTKMGNDYNVAVFGGEKAHIGSVVLSLPRESLSGHGISSTSSVMNVLGHKDEAVARLFAEKIAKEKNCRVVCSCGIHIDNATENVLEEINEVVELLLFKVLENM